MSVALLADDGGTAGRSGGALGPAIAGACGPASLGVLADIAGLDVPIDEAIARRDGGNGSCDFVYSAGAEPLANGGGNGNERGGAARSPAAAGARGPASVEVPADGAVAGRCSGRLGIEGPVR